MLLQPPSSLTLPGPSRRTVSASIVTPCRLSSHAAASSSSTSLSPVLSRCSIVSRATGGKLGDVSLFGGSSALSPSSPTTEKGSGGQVKVEDVPLESEVGMDYSALVSHLSAGDFRKADDETRALLIRLGGDGSVKRNWVYFSEVKSISVKDLTTLDELWKAASGGKFGYSVQKELWLQASKRWAKFFKTIDWVQGDNNNYRKWPAEFDYSLTAPKGHLPLTNALRGTQLFQAIMEHPAFEKKAGAKGLSLDDRSAAAGKNTLKW